MKKAWMVRPLPDNVNRMKEFKAENLIAVGWGAIGDLSNKDINDIASILDKTYQYKSARAMSNDKATLDIIVNRMQIGDYVVVPDEEIVYIGEITTEYIYDKTKAIENVYPHQRGIKWIGKPIFRSDLTLELRSSLKSPRTCAEITHREKDIKIALGEIVEDKVEEVDKNEFLTVKYPIRPDVNVKIEIPKDLKKSEATRLSEFIKTIFFDTEE